jgi:hypothetical protein
LFEEVCEVIEELSEPVGITDITGLMKWRSKHDRGPACQVRDILGFIKNRLLLRVDKDGTASTSGKYVTITDAGHAVRDGAVRQAA